MTEKCMNCNSMVEQVWSVSDELWNSLSGYPEGNGILCTCCFDRKAREQGVYLYWTCQPNSFPETYEGLLLAVLLSSIKKVKAGLRYSATEDFQDYPPGTIEVGTALDAIDMLAVDIFAFIETMLYSDKN